jgi:hypothetical protein
MTSVQLDQQRAIFIEALYQSSGRTCCNYTGLWQQFSLSVAANVRDVDADDLMADCVRAIGGTESALAEKHALACIKVMRAKLLDGWE